MIQVKLSLGKESTRKSPVGDVPQTFYVWDAQSRHLIITYYGVEYEPKFIPPEAFEALVEFTDPVANIKPLMPPCDPVALAAWEAGFFRALKAKSLKEARASISLAAKEAEQPRVVRGPSFVFVYRRTRRGREMLQTPFCWAVAHDASAEKIREALGVQAT